MFFFDKDDEKSKLCSANMDGFELSTIVTGLDEPLSKQFMEKVWKFRHFKKV